MEVTVQDLMQLQVQYPLAAEQLKVVVLERQVRELQAQLEEKDKEEKQEEG